jgi:hypothetical protein
VLCSSELGPVDSHGVKCLGIHDVEAAAFVHQYFGELRVADDGVNNKQISARLRDVIWMVIMVESDGRSKLVELGWHGRLSNVDLSVFQLVVAPGVIGHGGAKDHEAVVDDRKVIILLLVVTLVLLGSLAGVTLPLGTPEEVAFHHATLLEGVFNWALVVRTWFLEHLIKNSWATLGRSSRVLALSNSHKGGLA